jgi:very-short-patch-repair endonuclease
MTTVNVAGSNTSPLLTRRYSVTSRSLKTWYRAILRQEVNSVVFSKPAKKAGSSVPGPGSRLESEFALQLRAHGVTGWTREFRPIPTRRFRVDFAFVDQKIACEMDGGTWSGGRHTRGKGFEIDCEKRNLLQLAGWLTLHFTDKHLKDGSAIEMTKRALGLA